MTNRKKVSDRITLTRAEYTVVEVAHILGIQTRSVRMLFERKSEKYQDAPLLKAEKRGTLWYVKRDDLKLYLEEVYGV